MQSIDGTVLRNRSLPSGAVIFEGQHFDDERGRSWETLNARELFPNEPSRSSFVQENVVHTRKAGMIRGLHYQVKPFNQAKLVSVLEGSAQFFWVDLTLTVTPAPVHSIILHEGQASLWTPEWCAHGFLALADSTTFLLKMSQPINLALRGEISFFADDIEVEFACSPSIDWLSKRDSGAPSFADRRLLEPS